MLNPRKTCRIVRGNVACATATVQAQVCATKDTQVDSLVKMRQTADQTRQDEKLVQQEEKAGKAQEREQAK